MWLLSPTGNAQFVEGYGATPQPKIQATVTQPLVVPGVFRDFEEMCGFNGAKMAR